MRPHRPPMPLSHRVAALVAAFLALGALAGSVPRPPGSAAALPSWAEALGIGDLAVAGLFWSCLFSAAGAAVAQLLTVAVHPSGSRRITGRRLRHLAGLAITAVAGAAPPASAQQATEPPPTAPHTEPVQREWMVPIHTRSTATDQSPSSPDEDAPTTTAPRSEVGTARMEQIRQPPAAPPLATAETPPAQPVPTTELAPQREDPSPVAEPAPGTADGRWVVAAGDHLWGIAEETLGERPGDEPTLDQVVAYWQELIEVNRSRLVDPGNPDLIFPGQVLVLPEGSVG